MTTFDKRETAIEAAFALHQGVLFEARTSALREFAARAASDLGKSPDEARIYIDDLMTAFLQDGNIASIVTTVQSDFHSIGLDMTKRSLLMRYEESVQEATSARKEA